MKKARRNDLLIHPLTKKLLQVNWYVSKKHKYFNKGCLSNIKNPYTLSWQGMTGTSNVYI